MTCLEFLHLDLCRELLFLIMCLYLVFTTHPVVCLQMFGLGGIAYYTSTVLTYDLYSFIYMNLIFTIVLIIYSSVMLIQFTLTFYWQYLYYVFIFSVIIYGLWVCKKRLNISLLVL